MNAIGPTKQHSSPQIITFKSLSFTAESNTPLKYGRRWYTKDERVRLHVNSRKQKKDFCQEESPRMLYSKQKQGRPEGYNIHLHGPKQSFRSGRPTEGGDLHEEAQRRPYIAEKCVILIQDNEMRMRRWMFGMTRK